MWHIEGYPSHPSDVDVQEEGQWFYWTFRRGIQCRGCQQETEEYVSQNPLPLHSKEKLKEWYVGFRNQINARLGKKCDWTVEEAFQALYKRRAHNLRDLVATDLVRIEDHRLLLRMQQRMLRCRCGAGAGGVPPPTLLKDAGQSSLHWKEEEEEAKKEMEESHGRDDSSSWCDAHQPLPPKRENDRAFVSEATFLCTVLGVALVLLAVIVALVVCVVFPNVVRSSSALAQ